MILVTLGTQDKSFVRLLQKIDDLVSKKVIKEEVIVQAGYTTYKSENMTIFNLIEQTKLTKLIKDCNLLITHGGVGSIMEGIVNNKKVIAVPRLKFYNEHTNNHQLEIVKSFSDLGYILGCLDLNDLEKNLKNINKFIPKKYRSNTKKFAKIIEDFIDNN